MFPSRSSLSTRAAFAPLGPGCRVRSPPSSLICGPPTPLPLRHAYGLPSTCLTSRASVVSAPVGVAASGRPSDRLQPTARRSGSPVLRRPDPPSGRSGVSQVTGPSSSAVPQSITPPGPPSARLGASGGVAFRVSEPLGTRDYIISGLHSCGPPARLTTHQPPPHGGSCKPGYQPAGYALAGWGSHPQDDTSEFRSTSLDLLSDRPCLVASGNR